MQLGQLGLVDDAFESEVAIFLKDCRSSAVKVCFAG
jgi:hypothetical protein